MSNQARFENEAQVTTNRYQAEMDMKAYLSHWGGYEDVKERHKKELQDLAKKYGADLNYKDWKLNIIWV
jgi:predicted DsbA family dithiol-disulfide isomerase